MTRLTRLALTVTCFVCGVEPGRLCIVTRNHLQAPAYRMHRQRYNYARARAFRIAGTPGVRP